MCVNYKKNTFQWIDINTLYSGVYALHKMILIAFHKTVYISLFFCHTAQIPHSRKKWYIKIISWTNNSGKIIFFFRKLDTRCPKIIRNIFRLLISPKGAS
jgi:hypothetical protein